VKHRAGDGAEHFPVVYFAVSRSLLASGQRLALVARVHGASAARAFWHITLPMLSPALAAGMLLAFTLAIEEFGVPAALGTRAGVLMLTTDIEKLADWPVDLSGASMLSWCWWLSRCRRGVAKKLTGHHDVTSVTGKPTENSGANAGVYAADSDVDGACGRYRGDPAGRVDGIIRCIRTLSGGVTWS
jgi:iron(III) transport system permease protein